MINVKQVETLKQPKALFALQLIKLIDATPALLTMTKAY
jgi:hypothetical protein